MTSPIRQCDDTSAPCGDACVGRHRRMRRIAASTTVAAVALLAFGAPRPVAAGPPDPKRASQWGLTDVGAPDAWAVSTGAGVTVAIVDSGVDVNHPDLRAKLVPGYNAIARTENVTDDEGHGTHVAGIVGAEANNGVGVAGCAPDAKLMPIKVLDAQGNGDSATIAEGITWAVDHGAKVINLSLAGDGGIAARLAKGGPMNAAIRRAADAGAVVVAASGNGGKLGLGQAERNFRLGVPVLVVGAVNEANKVTEFSNYGDPRLVVAPGENIVSTIPTYPTTLFPNPGDGYGTLDGTSQATAFAACAAALLLAHGQPGTAVPALIADTANHAKLGLRGGAGLIDLPAALAAPVPTTAIAAPPAGPSQPVATAPGREAPGAAANAVPIGSARSWLGLLVPSLGVVLIVGAVAVGLVLARRSRRRSGPG